MSKLKILRSFLKRLWQINPTYVRAVIAQKLLISLRTIMMIVIPKLLIDFILQTAPRQEVLSLLVIIGLITLAVYLLQNLATRFVNLEQEHINLQFEQLFSDKLMGLPYHYLEDPTYLELKEAAMMGFRMGSVGEMMDHLSLLLEKTVIVGGLSALLIQLNPVLFLGICLSQGIVWWLLKRRSLLFRNTLQNIIPINRKLNYFIHAMLDDKVQKDVRLYDMSHMLTQNVYQYNELLISDFIALDWKDAVYTCVNHLINYLIAAAVFFYAGLRVLRQSLGIGSFTLYTNAAINFSLSVREDFAQILHVFNKIHFIEPIESFLSLPDEAGEQGKTFEETIEMIEFRNVWFRYPKTENWILKDINFTIHRGEKISIVGLNGAGKTTLVKLLCRFFDPDRGMILINGQDIQDITPASYMQFISAVFQDFQILNQSIAENILGEVQSDQTERQKAEMILDELDLTEKMASLPEGIDSYIGKNYHESGIELSGGQLQKIAIARALYKDAPLIILDEPTSALDPIAEAEIYEHFNQLIGQKTAIYISHRMSSSIFCDRIALIEDGRLVAIDSHDNLMKDKDSLYYRLFQTQAAHYQLSDFEAAT